MRKQQSGFTLIELLIAMSVSAVISVLAYQSIAAMVSTEQQVSAHQKAMQKQQRALWWIEQDLIQMAPRAINDGLNGVLPAMSFRADLGLEFSRLASFMTPNSHNGLLRVGYQFQDETLYRLTWPVIDRVADTEPTRMPILNSVSQIVWRFLDQNNQWQTTWPPLQLASSQTTFTEQVLPKAVEIQIQLANGENIKRLLRGTDDVIANFSQTSELETESELQSLSQENATSNNTGTATPSIAGAITE